MADISRVIEGYMYPYPTGITTEGSVVNGTYTYNFGFDGGTKSLQQLDLSFTNSAGDVYTLNIPGPEHTDVVNRDTTMYPTINDYLMGYDGNTGWLETNHLELYNDGWVVKFYGNNILGSWSVTVPGETTNTSNGNKYAPEGDMTVDIQVRAILNGDTYYWGSLESVGVSGYQVVDFDPALNSGDASGLDDSVAEVTDVTTPADSSNSLDGTYWTLNAPDAGAYYVWYDTGNGAGDPGASGTGIQVTISTGATASDVASATQAAIDAVSAFNATVSSSTVTVTNANGGAVTDAADSTAGVTISVSVQGTDGSTYSTDFSIDGGSSTVSITAVDARTVSDVVSYLGTNLASASVTLDSNGDIKVISDSTGPSSTVDISNDGIFSMMTNFNQLNTPVDGQYAGSDQAKTYTVAAMRDVDDDGYHEPVMVLDNADPNAVKVLDLRRMEGSMIARAKEIINNDPAGAGGSDYNKLISAAEGKRRFGSFIVTDMPSAAPGTFVVRGTPVQGSTAGKEGEIWMDSDYMYINTDGTVNGWQRASLSSF